MDSSTSKLVCLQLLGFLLAASCTDLSVSGEAAALLQTVASMQRASVPSHFFEDPAALTGPAAQRNGRAQRDLPDVPLTARFDVGRNAVPMPPQRRHHAAHGVEAGTVPFSLAESDQPAPSSQAHQQVPSAATASQWTPQSAMLQQAFALADQAEELKTQMNEAARQPQVALATEPPLAVETAKLPKAEPVPVAKLQEQTAQVPQVAAKPPANHDEHSNRDFEDSAETTDTAAKFVECQANGGEDCMHASKAEVVENAARESQKIMALPERSVHEVSAFQRKQELLDRQLQALEQRHSDESALQWAKLASSAKPALPSHVQATPQSRNFGGNGMSAHASYDFVQHQAAREGRAYGMEMPSHAQATPQLQSLAENRISALATYDAAERLLPRHDRGNGMSVPELARYSALQQPAPVFANAREPVPQQRQPLLTALPEQYAPGQELGLDHQLQAARENRGRGMEVPELSRSNALPYQPSAFVNARVPAPQDRPSPQNALLEQSAPNTELSLDQITRQLEEDGERINGAVHTAPPREV